MSKPNATDPHKCQGLPDGISESDAVAITYAIVNKYLDKMRDALFGTLGCEIPASCWAEMAAALNGEVIVMDDIIHDHTNSTATGNWFTLTVGGDS